MAAFKTSPLGTPAALCLGLKRVGFLDFSNPSFVKVRKILAHRDNLIEAAEMMQPRLPVWKHETGEKEQRERWRRREAATRAEEKARLFREA
ncbi:hypothetical protein M0R45_017599 [Rubus argutus]|uniref:Uncharacterized protein n=1 Tax=Rubus argutus TaxID=59490 RepID=A0AAW1XZJ2_RUBAR